MKDVANTLTLQEKLEGQVSFSFYLVGYASGIYYVYPTPWLIERGIVFQKHHFQQLC